MASCYDCKHFYSGASKCDYYGLYIGDEPVRTYYYNSDEYGRSTDASECRGFISLVDNSDGGSSDGCFLTSACVEHLGKADDCAELTTLRRFRDTYMKGTAQGNALVAEYYAVAPKIVEQIDASSDKDAIYDSIYGVISDCVKLIDSGDNATAQQRYAAMVNGLKTKFGF